ncbi:nucleotidyltransferase substrate binding protein [Methylotuvimicrobium sp. KM1]|uniref:nucleotidyltransferase substrate binding protein n=1 Tax=Methylotuvimicrobium sp. KM1 TaxID=3377707 RepID=UPI00384CFE46
MNNEIRWQQRFQNFERAFKQFAEIADADLNALSNLEKEGFIQRFEYTIELAWKTLKDYLLENGFDVNSPKDVFRQAFQNETIDDGEIWMDALKKRNLTSHTYNEVILNDTLNFLQQDFYPVIEKLYRHLKTELNG